jgi:hypothetical protein
MGGQGFADPITSGNVLIIPAIQSPNFSIAAKTGWAIMQDGSAYFFDVTVAGTLTGVTIDASTINGGTITGTDISGGTISGSEIDGGTVTGADILAYAFMGNEGLIASVSGSGGSDSFGNDWPAGLGFQANPGSASLVSVENAFLTINTSFYSGLSELPNQSDTNSTLTGVCNWANNLTDHLISHGYMSP